MSKRGRSGQVGAKVKITCGMNTNNIINKLC